jgi:leucyl-tRNA synthetase
MDAPHHRLCERLLQDLDTIDWTDSLKEMQRNWIGRSEGAEVEFEIQKGHRARWTDRAHRVFTTRPDTLFGATYMVLAPEQQAGGPAHHPGHRSRGGLSRVRAARATWNGPNWPRKRPAYSPAPTPPTRSREEIPIWIADYVLASYGTGAIMAVPGHDTRDLEFAQKFKLPIRAGGASARRGGMAQGFVEDGVSVNSEIPQRLPTPEAKRKITPG